MVRLGIFRGSSLKLFGAARFKSEFFLLSRHELTALHSNLVKLFTSLPHGPFQALSSLVGGKQARMLATNERECVLPDCYLNEAPLAQAVASGSSPRKRARDSSDDDLEIVGGSPMKGVLN